MKWLSRVCLGLRVVIGAAAIALIWAGAAKLVDIGWFQGVLRSHRLLPAASVVPASWAMAVSECALGMVTLGLGLSRRSAWLAAAALSVVMAGFSAYLLAVAIDPPNRASCGCGWNREPVESWPDLALQNAGIALVFALIAAAEHPGALPRARRVSVEAVRSGSGRLPSA